MFSRKTVVGILFVALVGLALVPPSGAVTANRATYITFSGPVRLPGVALPPGTYTFELPDPIGAYSVVRVSSRDRSRVYLTAFSRLVVRPAGLPREQLVSLGEAPLGAAVPVRVWWPADESEGREFIYR